MAEKKSWLRKYRKDIMKVILALIVLVFAVMGWHWTDTAEKPFWQHAWVWIAVGCLVLWGIVWGIFWSSDRRENENL